MTLFVWSDDLYRVDVETIDNQHKKLVALINELYEAMLGRKAREILDKVLTDLVAYTGYHFTAEENLMRTHGYPDDVSHKAEHDAAKQKALAFQRDFQSGKLMVAVELSQFLCDWLAYHIRAVDKQLGAFLNKKGVH